MAIFRFAYTLYDEIDEKPRKELGFVAGVNYTEAMSNIEKMCVVPGQEKSDILISIDTLYEVDDYGCNILYDDEIKDTYKIEKEAKKS